MEGEGMTDWQLSRDDKAHKYYNENQSTHLQDNETAFIDGWDAARLDTIKEIVEWLDTFGSRECVGPVLDKMRERFLK